VSRILKRRGVAFAVYAVLLAGTGLTFNAVPRGFIPTQDKLYLIAGVKLPEGASISRSDVVVKQMVSMALETEGVAHTVSFAGLNATQFTNTPNYAIAFVILKKFDERHVSAKQIADAIQAKLQHNPGRHGFRDDAAANPRPWQRRRLFAVRRGSRRQRLRVLQQGVARCKVG